MLCPPTHGMCGLSAAVPHTDQLQLYRVTWSCRHVSRSRSASRVELCPNRRLLRCCRITWRSGGGVVAFHCCSRLLMFVHDTYSGSNGRLTPFVSVHSNAISLNHGSITVATQVRSRDVTGYCICELKFKYREMTSQTKPNICHLSYSMLRHMPQMT